MLLNTKVFALFSLPSVTASEGMQAIMGCSYDKEEAYDSLDKLGVNTAKLRELEPTLHQLDQLLVRLSSIHDKKLLRFLSSMIETSPNC